MQRAECRDSPQRSASQRASVFCSGSSGGRASAMRSRGSAPSRPASSRRASRLAFGVATTQRFAGLVERRAVRATSGVRVAAEAREVDERREKVSCVRSRASSRYSSVQAKAVGRCRPCALRRGGRRPGVAGLESFNDGLVRGRRARVGGAAEAAASSSACARRAIGSPSSQASSGGRKVPVPPPNLPQPTL